MSLILVDVEATGISPHSGVMTEFGAVDFKSRAGYHGVLWDAYSDPENPAKPKLGKNTRLADKQFEHEYNVMDKFAKWLNQFDGRPIFVSDNNGYDSQWINFYFDKTLGKNPFGHSSRRISDFYAGLQGDFYQTQNWKSLRITKHDHNPVNDAMGNAEALAALIQLTK